MNCSIGYRQMWRILQIKYNICVKRCNIAIALASIATFHIDRSTVMMLLRLLDPEGSERRRGHRLRRRVYQNKVHGFLIANTDTKNFL